MSTVVTVMLIGTMQLVNPILPNIYAAGTMVHSTGVLLNTLESIASLVMTKKVMMP